MSRHADQTLLVTLAAIARGEVADRGERYAAAAEAEDAALALQNLLKTSIEAANALEELAGVGLVDRLLVERLRAAIRGAGGPAGGG